MHNTGAVAALPRGDRLIILSSLGALTLLAWAYLLRVDRQMAGSMSYAREMAAMGMSTDAPWTATDALFTFVMWLVMMVGMMAASAAPLLLLFAAASRTRGAGLMSTGWFGLGYSSVWGAFSAVAAVAQWSLHQAALLTPAMAASSPVLAGAILILAGAYQFTPAKGACLARCQSPLGFLLSNWRSGNIGALAMGARHGVFCLGCCWALMGVLFAVGVMNLIWVAALAAFVLIEKMGVGGTFIARAAGGATIAFGIAVAFSR